MEGHSSVVGCGYHPRNQITEGMTNEQRNNQHDDSPALRDLLRPVIRATTPELCRNVSTPSATECSIRSRCDERTIRITACNRLQNRRTAWKTQRTSDKAVVFIAAFQLASGVMSGRLLCSAKVIEARLKVGAHHFTPNDPARFLIDCHRQILTTDFPVRDICKVRTG